MKICIVVEGSYPYIAGEVSSWIQTLISSITEHQFIVYSINAQEKQKGKFRYKLPVNVEEVREVFIDTALKESGAWGKSCRIKPGACEGLKALLTGKEVRWEDLFSFFRRDEFGGGPDFLMSRGYFDILQAIYRKRYSQVSFNDFCRTMRAMLLPLIYIIRQDLPRADIYHSLSTGYAGIVGSLGKYLYNKPFVITEHRIYTREMEEDIIKSDWSKIYFKDAWIEHFYSLSKCAYSKADKVITLFNSKRGVQIDLGCDKEKTGIVPNGIAAGDFLDLPVKDAEDDFINIGAVVQVVPVKDIKTMIQGFAVAKEKVPQIRLFIIGPGDEDERYFEECKQLVESLELKDVVFTGNVNARDYLGRMDILLLSSISEGQPLCVLEAMACGKPVIATDVGNCRDLLYGRGDNYGDAGVIVPVMDYEKMGHAIIKLSGNEYMRKVLGNNGFNRVSRLYTREEFITAYKNIYQGYEVL